MLSRQKNVLDVGQSPDLAALGISSDTRQCGFSKPAAVFAAILSA